MLPRSLIAPLLVATACLVLPPAAHAQTQVKPYFLVIFDTSGSMTDAPDLANTCGYTSGGRAGGRKIDAAKCALGKIVNGTGDADFGLMQFAQSWTMNVDGSVTCGEGASCGPTAGSALMRVPIESNTALPISELIDNAGVDGTEELCSGGYTPLGGTLVAAKDYFEGNLNYEGNASVDAAPTAGDAALACRPLSVILLTDGVECCTACSDSGSTIYNEGCPNADDEIEAAGLDACPAGDPDGCGSWGGCMNGDAFESAPEKAWLLREQSMVPSAAGRVDKEVRTYVIGFGITAPDDRIERIAIGGGTDNPSDGPDGLRAFYASNEAALSIAFSQIIADSQPPSEECNGLDDDCDTLIDEGFQKYCTPGGSRELTECEEPDELLCDGIDDDCDGIIDEGTMNECGACGDETPAEVCDGFDNDCDGEIDENTSGGECGSDEGECEAGELRCLDGMLECVGLVGPEPEQCNGLDDDCDGIVDEDPTGILCPDGRCIAGECLPFCESTEFIATCDNDRDPEIQPNGECLCVNDNCDDLACQADTKTREDGESTILLCAPDDDAVAECSCRAGLCTHVCDGVTCPDDQICDPRRGVCAMNNCRGLGCAAGELCDVSVLECVVDPCADADCESVEVCRAGVCEPSCADVVCEDGEKCSRGVCARDLCDGILCDDRSLRCNPANGECEEDACAEVACDFGLVCEPESAECERDPCFAVRCPSQQSCRQGECVRTSGSGTPIPGNPQRLLATGGGGCACSVVRADGGARNSGALPTLAGLGFLLLVFARGQRRARVRVSSHALMLMLVLLMSTLVGCEVTPFCVNCVSPTGNDGGGGVGGSSGGNGGSSGFAGVGGSGSGGNGGTAGNDPDGGETDAQVGGDAGCNPIPELCNGADDDCDFRVDENQTGDGRLEALVNNCKQAGLCAGSSRLCVAADTFECQYPAGFEDTEETLCDGVDEDCDGDIDEAFAMLGDTCSLGIGACTVAGELECNGAGTGLVCVVGEAPEPGDEECDGVDNDCDGLVDEPESEPGMNESYVHDALVQVASSLWMYKYEASRPDATDDAQGIIAERACSRADVLPWTNLSYEEAVEACEDADMELCGESAWVDACNANGNTCVWGYTPSAGACTSYPSDGANACNGHDLTAEPGATDHDALAPTGSFERCFAEQIAGGKVFDLSGNAKEWVTDDPSVPAMDGDLPPGSNPHRGGSYNNLPGGMRCDFAFAAANDDVRLRNVGFRCCTDQAP